jgi:hypothetical protein
LTNKVLPRVPQARTRSSHPTKKTDKKKGRDKEAENEIPAPNLKSLKKGDVRRFFRQAYKERWRIGGTQSINQPNSTMVSLREVSKFVG